MLKLLPADVPGSVWFDRIDTPVEGRRHGGGTRVLQAMLADADGEGVTIFAQVASEHGEHDMTALELFRWYERYGFRQIEGRLLGSIVRHPAIEAFASNISARGDVARCCTPGHAALPNNDY